MISIFFSPGAIELESSQFELNIESLKGSGADYLEAPEFLAQEEAFDFEENDKSIYEYTYKSPKKAFLYSLLIADQPPFVIVLILYLKRNQTNMKYPVFLF